MNTLVTATQHLSQPCGPLQEAGVENVEFLKDEIEHIPLPDSSVDVIIK